MQHYLISEAIGDIAGSAYEGRVHRIKDYNKVKLFSSRAHFTDDTVPGIEETARLDDRG